MAAPTVGSNDSYFVEGEPSHAGAYGILYVGGTEYRFLIASDCFHQLHSNIIPMLPPTPARTRSNAGLRSLFPRCRRKGIKPTSMMQDSTSLLRELIDR